MCRNPGRPIQGSPARIRRRTRGTRHDPLDHKLRAMRNGVCRHDVETERHRVRDHRRSNAYLDDNPGDAMKTFAPPDPRDEVDDTLSHCQFVHVAPVFMSDPRSPANRSLRAVTSLCHITINPDGRTVTY